MSEKEIKSMDDVDLGAKPRTGEVVKGIVVEVKPDLVLLDVNSFTEGKLYLNHYTADKNVTSFVGLLNVGDEIEVEITKVEIFDDNAQVILCSCLKLEKEKKYVEVVNAFKDEAVIEVYVDKKTEKGFIVSYKGFRFFMPRSQASRNLTEGQTINVKITALEENRRSAIVSERLVLTEELAKTKEAELQTLNEGDVVKGKVVKILPFAAFVEFGHLQGMLRLPEVSHIFIEKIEDVLNVGDEVEVKILSIKNGKIALSRKALLKTPFEAFAASHKKGETIRGKIVNKLPYGLLVELAQNVRGLLYQTEYSWNPNDNFNDYVKIGDEVEVAILEIDEAKQRISLSRKALIDNPWTRVEAKVGDVVSCTVKEADQNGLKVETLGVDGFIPRNACLVEGQNGKVDDYFAPGDTVNAVITELKPREWNLRLSIRRLKEQEERAHFEKYLDNEEDATVTIGDMYNDILNK